MHTRKGGSWQEFMCWAQGAATNVASRSNISGKQQQATLRALLNPQCVNGTSRLEKQHLALQHQTQAGQTEGQLAVGTQFVERDRGGGRQHMQTLQPHVSVSSVFTPFVFHTHARV